MKHKLFSTFFMVLAGLLSAGSPLLAQTTHTAYVIPSGTAGNQAFAGALGMDFDVANTVKVTQLGCFDDNSDGIQVPISVRLYNRDTQEVLASLDFAPGDDGTPAGGSRFKALAVALNLPTGFHGTIVAEGYDGTERVGNRQPAPWTTDNGNGSISFVGTARYNFPIVAGAFPDSPDGGPASRYAAGTFEFVTTPPEKPGAAVPAAVPAKARVDLSWTAVMQPLPAATYRILRSNAPDGVFTQIAEIPGLSYADTSVINGVLYYYRIVGIGAGGQVGLDSVVVGARPYDLGADRLIAYDTPWGIAGNQNFNGSVGMDFDVANPVIIRQLGCFDDNSDGLFTTISVRVYNRETQEVMAELVFDPDDSGTVEREDGEPIGGMRFKPLVAPLELPLGFHGVIVAEGYNDMERLRNSFGQPSNIVWSTRSGAGSLVFTGTSRYNFPIVAGAFPASPDTLPAQFAAGTFIFETTPPVVPGPPLVSSLSENHAVRLTWNPVTLPLPAVSYRILRADTVGGPFTLAGETSSTSYLDTGLANGVEQFYVVRAVGAGGQVSVDSVIAYGTPAARQGGVAYVVPVGTSGNQAFGGSLGMEFDVDRPVMVTRLGAFDSEGDGIQQPISVRLYNRATAGLVASLLFEPGNDGELVGGSRFLPLIPPLALPAGFQGMIVASGYGPLERNGNLFSNLGLTTFSGACLRFVGMGNYSEDPGVMANNPDGGPANRYAAGTFAFEPDLPPTGLSILLNGAGTVRVNWTDASGVLERTTDLELGPWEMVPGATTGLLLPANQSKEFFRLTR